jgi:hypothetical protein
MKTMGAANRDNVIPFAPRRRADIDTQPLGDLRFRRLLGDDGWARLPPAVRARFAKRLAGAASHVYRGEVLACRISRAGRVLAMLGRLIGAPLPLTTDVLVPAVVTVTEDEAGNGQFWTRQYGRHHGFPQVIHSAKRFAGPTGLEEYVGGGVGVALRLQVAGEALHFVSDHYFWQAGPIRLRLPRWLSPGTLTVSHTDCDGGWFAFGLRLDHPWFGTMIEQTALFRDPN